VIDDKAQKFGLPRSLLVPIAARSLDSIERYVGVVVERFLGRTGRINAIAVKPHEWPAQKERNVALWTHVKAGEFEQRLHPKQQVWVHVDYSGYRRAYMRLGIRKIPANCVLDHVQNREAIRLRGYSHPYLRLCPVSRQVNTSGGANTGGEGMEKEFLRSLPDRPKAVQESVRDALMCDIVYADPMDLTKMLDISPGTQALAGVGESLKLFYPGRSSAA
jgi:hypothetical protein